MFKGHRRYQSWGQPGRGRPGFMATPHSIARAGTATLLPFGNGRSYGDSCAISDGDLIDTHANACIRGIDLAAGTITVDAGVTLGSIIAALGPSHTLPVVPGTQFVTVGGAIANDIHGKNHHRRGSFGAHVKALWLRRSDANARMKLTATSTLFQRTLGGMGMTGLIERAELALMPVSGHAIAESTHHAADLDAALDGLAAADERHEYVVAWIDSLATGTELGRGLVITGDHVAAPAQRRARSRSRLAVPLTPPISPLNTITLRAFNAMVRGRVPSEGRHRVVPQSTFFWPLDSIGDWNRLYGPRGLHQHQSVLPFDTARDAVREMLTFCQRMRHGSFLTVLKRFGENRSPATMSFSRPGITLTLDFPDNGPVTSDLLDRLDSITLTAGGAVNPYKDRGMSAATFAASMPGWHFVEAVRDPVIVSDFWKRTALTLPGPQQVPAGSDTQIAA